MLANQPHNMSKKPLFLCAIMILMVLQPAIANSVAPNDSIESNGQTSTLSVDGYVSTKFSSVGDTVDIFALTRGHSMSNSGSTNTIVTADIRVTAMNTLFRTAVTFVR